MVVICYLVGGLEHLDYFSIYWECHHPNCYSLTFFRGVGQPPTSESIIINDSPLFTIINLVNFFHGEVPGFARPMPGSQLRRSG